MYIDSVSKLIRGLCQLALNASECELKVKTWAFFISSVSCNKDCVLFVLDDKLQNRYWQVTTTDRNPDRSGINIGLKFNVPLAQNGSFLTRSSQPISWLALRRIQDLLVRVWSWIGVTNIYHHRTRSTIVGQGLWACSPVKISLGCSNGADRGIHPHPLDIS